MSAKIHIFVHTFALYKTDFNVSRHPLCANRAGRVRYALWIADVLVLQIVRELAYLSTVLDLCQLFCTKTMRNDVLYENERRDDGYSARCFIPMR